MERKAAGTSKLLSFLGSEVYEWQVKSVEQAAAARAVMEMNAYWAEASANTSSHKHGQCVALRMRHSHLPRWKSYQWR